MAINVFGDDIGGEVEEPEEITEYKPPLVGLYDWLSSINTNKIDLRFNLVPGSDDKGRDSEMKGYNAFIINKGLSQSKATLGFAALMNRMSHIPEEYQYLFFLYGIPKNKAYAKWAKSKKYDKLKEVKAILGYSDQKAKEAIDVLGEDGVKKLLHIRGGKVE